jgi:hypothetical protein
MLVPGETAAPGNGQRARRAHRSAHRTAGTAFNVTANTRVDANWNLVSTNDHGGDHLQRCEWRRCRPTLHFGSAAHESVSASRSRLTAGSATVTASNVTHSAITANTSPPITVSAAAFAKFQALAPGENAAPGSASGKTGTPNAQAAGTAFNVTVNAVDANWNLVNTITDTVAISSSDTNAVLPGNAALVGGTQTFAITFKTAGSRTVTATDVTDGTKTANTSSSITVNAGAFVKLQLLVPGETAVPGTVSGKSGTPSGQVAGTRFQRHRQCCGRELERGEHCDRHVVDQSH